MLIPLNKEADVQDAKALARRLSRVSISNLLSHKGGIAVYERLSCDRGEWEREYRIRFIFENHMKIYKAFGISFSDLEESINTNLKVKLLRIIHTEQRRSGEKLNKEEIFKQFKSTVSDIPSSSFLKKSSNVDGEDDVGDTEEKGLGHTNGKGKKSYQGLDGEDDDDEDEEDDNDDEMIDTRDKKKSKDKENIEVSDEENEEDDEEDDNDDIKANINKIKKSNDSDVESQESDSDLKKKSSRGTLQSSKPEPPPRTSLSSKSGSRKSKLEDLAIKGNKKENWIEAVVRIPAASRRLLMVQLAEQAAKKATVRETKDITNAYSLQCDISGESRWGVQTEGVNFEAIWDLNNPLIEYNELKSNHIWEVLNVYGIEAGRYCIVSEIQAVFAVYGIDVNPRHLTLIADFMTRCGTFVAMNRIGMKECSSPFLQMSFETTCTFLTKAAQEGAVDNMESPSSRIVLGSVPRIGTGCFELMIPVGMNDADTIMDAEDTLG